MKIKNKDKSQYYLLFCFYIFCKIASLKNLVGFLKMFYFDLDFSVQYLMTYNGCPLATSKVLNFDFFALIYI